MTAGAPGPRPPIAIIGLGRMGRAVDEVAASKGWPVRARLGRGTAIDTHSLSGAAVAIDFTRPDAAAANVLACVAALIGSFWLPEPAGELLPD